MSTDRNANEGLRPVLSHFGDGNPDSKPRAESLNCAATARFPGSLSSQRHTLPYDGRPRQKLLEAILARRAQADAVAFRQFVLSADALEEAVT